MAAAGFQSAPDHTHYDVIIIGGAMMGSSIAFHLTARPDFAGRVLVVEQDPSYEASATAHTNSCLRQQFSTALNIRISQHTAAMLRDFPAYVGDARAPALSIQNFGYLYLAGDPAAAERLRTAATLQTALGAGTELLSPADLAARFPYFCLDDIVLGSLNTRDEGYWDGGAVFDWFRRRARAQGATYLHGRVIGIDALGGRVTGVHLADGTRIGCGTLVNAAGPRAAAVAAWAGATLPIEPRKRYTWVVRLETPLPGQLPLTVDPTGVHMRQDGPETYMIGAPGRHDPAVEPDDFAFESDLWEDHVWPQLAARISAFERLKVLRGWVGHYDYNTLDQNAVLGPLPELPNLMICAGFSGHGLQQAPAMGRGLAEWICTGGFETLDLGPFLPARLRTGDAVPESAVI